MTNSRRRDWRGLLTIKSDPVSNWRASVVLTVMSGGLAGLQTWQAVRYGGERWIVAVCGLLAFLVFVGITVLRYRTMKRARQ